MSACTLFCLLRWPLGVGRTPSPREVQLQTWSMRTCDLLLLRTGAWRRLTCILQSTDARPFSHEEQIPRWACGVMVMQIRNPDRFDWPSPSGEDILVTIIDTVFSGTRSFIEVAQTEPEPESENRKSWHRCTSKLFALNNVLIFSHSKNISFCCSFRSIQ